MNDCKKWLTLNCWFKDCLLCKIIGSFSDFLQCKIMTEVRKQQLSVQRVISASHVSLLPARICGHFANQLLVETEN